jgi:hypothetical protein
MADISYAKEESAVHRQILLEHRQFLLRRRYLAKIKQKEALGGVGRSVFIQVFSLMWLRTSMNYQYRCGGDLDSSLQVVLGRRGIPACTKLPFAMSAGPFKFGDTAANMGILAVLDTLPPHRVYLYPLKRY